VLFVAMAVLLSLVVSAVVALYVAYPHRGAQMPVVPWLGEAMGRAVDAAPVLDDDERDVMRWTPPEGDLRAGSSGRAEP